MSQPEKDEVVNDAMEGVEVAYGNPIKKLLRRSTSEWGKERNKGGKGGKGGTNRATTKNNTTKNPKRTKTSAPVAASPTKKLRAENESTSSVSLQNCFRKYSGSSAEYQFRISSVYLNFVHLKCFYQVVIGLLIFISQLWKLVKASN